MPTSVRLDENTRRLLDRLMRKKGKTQSEVIREAIEVLARSESTGGDLSPYEAVEDLIGCVSGAPDDLSENTGKKFYELLLAERNRRDRR